MRHDQAATGWRRRTVRRALFLVTSVTLALPVERAAAADSTAKAAVVEPVRIWYRSSEGCPEGSAFVLRVTELGREAALARIGDRIDFVVTLVRNGDTSAGRLERQTEQGTVALRELSAPTCDEIAEALALTLELTLAPEPTDDSSPVVRPAAAEASAAAQREDRVVPQDRGSGRSVSPTQEARLQTPFHVGAHVGVATAVGPGLALGGKAFVGFENLARLSAMIAHGRGPLDVRDEAALDGAQGHSATLKVGLFGGRLDSCPLGFDAERFELYPCLGFELGLLTARSDGPRARADEGLWSAGLALLRAGLKLTPSTWFEIELGARVPFVQYAMSTTAGTELFRTASVGGELDLGIRWAP